MSLSLFADLLTSHNEVSVELQLSDLEHHRQGQKNDVSATKLISARVSGHRVVVMLVMLSLQWYENLQHCTTAAVVVVIGHH